MNLSIRQSAIASMLGAACLAAVVAAQCLAEAAPEVGQPLPPSASPGPAANGELSLAAGPSYRLLVPPPADDSSERLAACARRCAAALAAGGVAAPPAQERLLEVQRSILETLDSYVDDADLEVRLRIAEVLEDMIVEARVVRMIASLPADQRSALVQFRRLQPGLFAETLSQDWGRRAAAVRKLTKRTDPQKLAEPLIVLCLRHPSSELVTEAARAVERCEYGSEAVLDALSQALNRFRGDPRGSQAVVYYDGRVFTSPILPIVGAMGSIGGPAAAADLIDAMLNGRSLDVSATVPMVDALVETSELRAVPTLMQRLDANNGSQSYSWGMQGVSGTTLMADYALWVVLRLTGQSPAEYGMIVLDYRTMNPYAGSPCYVGFEKDKDRKAAYEKARAWWAAHQDKPPYQGLASLDVQRAGAGAGEPASRPALASAPAEPPIPLPADDVGPRAAAAARRLAETFRSSSLFVRDTAHGRLLELYRSLLQPLADAVHDRDAEGGKRLLDALEEAVIEAGIRSAQFQLPPELRRKLAAFLAEEPKLARAAFGLNWSARVEAANTLASRGDPNALAEPIVLLYLKDPTPQITEAGLKLAATGRYRCDPLVDALDDMLAQATTNEWFQASYAGAHNQESSLAAVLGALTKIRSPHAAPALLELVMQRSASGQACPPALGDALIATGELGVIPHFLEALQDTHLNGNRSNGNGKALTTAPCDVPLLLLLKITGQDPSAYQIVATNEFGEYIVGFRDEKARSAAIRKFGEWWGKAKDAPPYKGLKPLGRLGAALPNSEDNGAAFDD